MRLRALLGSLRPRPARRPAQPAAPRLRVEPLEDRSLPSGTVTLAPSEPERPLTIWRRVRLFFRRLRG